MGPNNQVRNLQDLRTIKRDEDTVSLWLDEFGIRSTRTREHLYEPLQAIRQIVSQDYRDLPALPAGPTLRLAQRLVGAQTLPHPDLFGPRLSGSSFSCSSDDFCNDRLAVTGAPYTSGAGRLMWGFSADLRDTSRQEFMIYLNTAHSSGAIETTLIHEVGHYLFRLMNGDRSKQHNPLFSTFVSHMNDESELFCDSLAAVLAYGDCGRRWYAGLNGVGADQLFRRVRELYRTIGPNYFIDLSDTKVSSEWRLIYLSALIHFCKLRSALLEVAGV